MQLISISIVSHSQGSLVAELLGDIERYCAGEPLEVILTLNLPEVLAFSADEYFFPLKIISNPLPKGFGENHNQAFEHASGDFFCVLNPDIRIQENIFNPLIQALNESDRIGLVAPQVVDPNGKAEDSARKFPDPGEIFGKVFGRSSRRFPQGSGHIMYPDWVAGMFMLFPASVYREIGGFDKRYFLYYEDVDLCARLRLCDYHVALCQNVTVIHHARRSSHRELKYLCWHIASLWRFFRSGTYREVRRISDEK